VGEDGGTFSLSNGARLEIPEGALAEDVELTFSVGTATQSFNNREDVRPVGPSVMAQPAVVLQPGTRITISSPMGMLPDDFTNEDLAIAYEEVSEAQRAMQMGTVQTIWQYGPARAEGSRMVAELSQLSGLRFQFVVSR